MPLYKIPLFKRFTNVSTFPDFATREKCLHVDQVGLFVSYKNEKDLTPEFIRRHLVGRRKIYCLIEAENAAKAIEILFEQYEGMKVGGEHEEAKALWIDKEEYILELPSCELMHKSKEGRFICGEEEGENGNGEFGMCILEGYDAPSKCPVAEFYENLHRMKKANVIIGGYSVILSAAYRN